MKDLETTVEKYLDRIQEEIETMKQRELPEDLSEASLQRLQDTVTAFRYQKEIDAVIKAARYLGREDYTDKALQLRQSLKDYLDMQTARIGSR